MKNDSIYLKEIYIKFTKISSKIPQLWVLHWLLAIVIVEMQRINS
jgi:hypothetical protein